jgi:hypothetical protein
MCEMGAISEVHDWSTPFWAFMQVEYMLILLWDNFNDNEFIYSNKTLAK